MQNSQQYTPDTPESIQGAGFVPERRSSFTKVEDWVIHHPRVTPAVLMLYVKLRSTVYEGNKDDHLDSRLIPRTFTVEQMRLMLPCEKKQKQSDTKSDRVAASTIRKHLQLLQEIGAIRRINTDQPNKTPVYEFASRPPADHDGWACGLQWGSALQSGAGVPAPSYEEGAGTPEVPVHRRVGAGTPEGGCRYTAPNTGPDLGFSASKKFFKESLSKNGTNTGPDGPGERESAAPQNPEVAREAGIPEAKKETADASLWRFSETVDGTVAETAASAGVKAEDAIHVLEIWGNLVHEYCGRQATDEELLAEGEAVVGQLVNGRTVADIQDQLERDFREME
ncbi:hypothetical protein ABT282_07630 [Streptomyces sp. NPDC000927]|uniref:hypothetical protein n=1 Tax=Streptomyces sp. NPDC000927 TaxID=3154371 RepID=UPI00332020D5